MVSIHAPVKGATSSIDKYGAREERFNPRTREGCDVEALVRAELLTRFNPRTREGCDGIDINTPLAPLEFQSTHP